MIDWTYHVDESYDKQVFCLGGWIAPERAWSKISDSWDTRIAYESRYSVKRGFPPISRYHATDCANLKREFDESKGWDIDRQIRLSGKLCGILASVAPLGIVHGAVIPDFALHWPNADVIKSLYYISFGIHLIDVGKKMQEGNPDDRVTILYERSEELGPVAQAAFHKFKTDPYTRELAKYFVTCAPMGWEDCTPLQSADLLAYEGLKRIRQNITGSAALRKSLQAILGKRTQIEIGWLRERHFKALREAIAEGRNYLQL